MRFRLCAMLLGIGLALAALKQPPRPAPPRPTAPIGFAPPKVILDGSEYNARLHPHYADFDGDGKIDQLAGVWDRLLIFRNLGTNAKPVYAKPTYFDAVEPSAHLPHG